MVRGASEVLRSGQVTIQDFYRSELDQRIHLGVLVPIFDEQDARRPLGAFFLRIDPETYLYPFIKRWPTASLTAETLLVRREGNEAVFLNELRFQTNTALNLRLPLDRVALPAAQAASGREGFMEGIDYRGAPVVAALRAIPDSPWSLVARMDTAEAFAPMREQLWQVAAMIGALLFGAAAFTGLVWRQQRVRFYRDGAKTTEALRVSEVRYRRLFEAARDGILILDNETGMVMDVNPFLIELLGYSREAFLGKKVWELGFFKDIVANQAHFAELQQKEYIRYEDKPLETSDGRRIEVEFVSNVYQCGDKRVTQCNIRDMTQRNSAQRTAVRLASIVESSDDAIIGKDLDGNIQSWNAGAEKLFGYSAGEMVGRPITPLIPAELLDEEHSILEKIKRGESVPHLETARLRKDGSRIEVSITVSPIKDSAGKVVGASKVARDITERKRAEAALRQSREEFKELFDSAPIGYHELDAQGRLTRVNQTELEMLGYQAGELLGQFVWFITADPEASRQAVLTKLSGVAAAGKVRADVPAKRRVHLSGAGAG